MAEQKETKNPVQSAERIFQVMEMLGMGVIGVWIAMQIDWPITVRWD